MTTTDFAERDQKGRMALYPMLARRASVNEADFKAYWRDVHGLVIASLPGIFQYRQIAFDLDHGDIWPEVSGIDRKMPAGFKADGIAELVFADQTGMQAFIEKVWGFAALDDHMAFGKECCYVITDGNIRTFKDRLADPGADASRLMVLMNAKAGVSSANFRRWLTDDIALALAQSGFVAKVRTVLFEPLEIPPVDPNVDKQLAPDEIYDAVLELAFDNNLDRRKFFLSRDYQSLIPGLQSHVARMNACPVSAYLPYVNDGQRTLIGRLGTVRADLVTRIGAMHISADSVWL